MSGFHLPWQVRLVAAEEHGFALLPTPSPSLLGVLTKDALPLVKGNDTSKVARFICPVHQSQPALQSKPAHQPHRKSSDLCWEVAFTQSEIQAESGAQLVPEGLRGQKTWAGFWGGRRSFSEGRPGARVSFLCTSPTLVFYYLEN